MLSPVAISPADYLRLRPIEEIVSVVGVSRTTLETWIETQGFPVVNAKGEGATRDRFMSSYCMIETWERARALVEPSPKEESTAGGGGEQGVELEEGSSRERRQRKAGKK